MTLDKFNHIPIRYDNISMINLTKNPIQNFRAKHIDIGHHFLHNHVHKNEIVLQFICINNQLINIFVGLLSEERLCMIKGAICMLRENSI